MRLTVFLVLALLMTTARADADEPTGVDPRPVAQSLFDDARALMAEGKYAEACPKLAESQRLDPGGGTLLNLAVCHEGLGRTATAWAEFNDALSVALRDGRASRQQTAREHIAALAPRLDRMAVGPAAGADVPGLEITLDGVAVGRAAWGTATPVDPGRHVVGATAPGAPAWSRTVDVGGEGTTTRVEVPRQGSASPPSPPTPVDVAPPAQGSDTRRIVGWTAIGVGGVGLVVGTIVGLRALSDNSDASKTCPGGACDASGLDLNQRAIREAWISDVAFGVGVVGVGLGTYLVLTSSSSSPSVHVGLGRVSLSGTF